MRTERLHIAYLGTDYDLQERIPAFNEEVKWVADHYGLPYTPLDPNDPEACWALRVLDRTSNLLGRKGDVEQALEFADEDFSLPRYVKYQPYWRNVRAILERMLPDTLNDPDKGWRIRHGGNQMFDSAKEILERKLAA